MDSERFDELLRSVATGTTRRGLLAGLTGGLLAALPLALVVDDAAAKKHRKRRKRKTRKRRHANGAPSAPPDAPPPPPPPPPPPAPVTRADATCSGEVNSVNGFVDGNARLAQTFSALASGPLVRAELVIDKLLGSQRDYILRLSPVDGAGAPTNDVLAESAVPSASVPDGSSTVAFTFATPFSVVTGTAYALVLTRPGSEDLHWGGRSGNVCPGQLFNCFDQTSPFVPNSSGTDLFFTTFVSS